MVHATSAGTADVTAAPFPVPANTYAEKVVSVTHFTHSLFSFRITRPSTFRFRSGEFVMIGLPNAERPVFRAYSIASPAWDEEIEFYSIKVPDGPLTQHLQKIRPGDTVLMKQKPTGTLVLDALTPGRRLWMIATGTGFAPFASLLRDPETYEKFDEVVITNTCRNVDDLAYGDRIVEGLAEDPLIGEYCAGRVKYFASTTREPSQHFGRITTLIDSGALFKSLDCPQLDPRTDRVMICGSMAMLNDVKALVEAHGFTEGSNSQPADFVVERAFVG